MHKNLDRWAKGLIKSGERDAVRVGKAARARQCGDCSECCTVMAVSEIEKPADTPCRHHRGRGCAIYATRPEPCQTWLCAWRYGVGPASSRPDKCGVLVIPEPGKPYLGVRLLREITPEEVPEALAGIGELLLDSAAMRGYEYVAFSGREAKWGAPESAMFRLNRTTVDRYLPQLLETGLSQHHRGN